MNFTGTIFAHTPSGDGGVVPPFLELELHLLHSHSDVTVGKRRLNFATFTTKKHFNFPIRNLYHIDIITKYNFSTGEFNTNCWKIVEAVFHFKQ